ncbi:MAG: 2-hydroxyhepta-2,4-diene-1,7-dioate isomerase, partial [Bacteroidota bacterium]|nr:2-hydroxyhepta-2,4-diene-1,7-dioate isomerase [Bacteroidota bacterium]
MKLYNTSRGIVLVRGNDHYALQNESWDDLINDDELYAKLSGIGDAHKMKAGISDKDILPPVG